MPFVQAKCTQCGGDLQVDSAQDAAICGFCGTAFIIAKAIEHYNTTNHIQANIVNMYGADSADFVVRAGTLEKYNGAATEVFIPYEVKEIGPFAFKGCTNLKSIVIPVGVKIVKKNWEYVDANDSTVWLSRPDSYITVPEDTSNSEVMLSIIDCLYQYEHQYESIVRPVNLRINGIYTNDILEKHQWEQQEKLREQQEKTNKMIQENILKFQVKENEWKSQGLCRYCGGAIGLLSRCKKCKRKQ